MAPSDMVHAVSRTLCRKARSSGEEQIGGSASDAIADTTLNGNRIQRYKFIRNMEILSMPMERKRLALSEAETGRRRARNRENMRKRRQEPEFRAAEKWKRKHQEGDAMPIASSLSRATAVGELSARIPRRCSICAKRTAVEVITRLRPCAEARGGYVEIRIAYCGFC